MACYHPLKAFYKINRDTGKKDICFAHYPGETVCYDDKGNLYPFKIDIPCGQCVGCRLEYSRQWAIRCVLESLQYEHNYFVTLTYNPENLPQKENYVVDYDTGEAGEKFYSAPLVPEHLTTFMKDLRRHFEYHYNHIGIRFFACGEYGSQSMRPHFHLILFNCPIPDLDFFKSSFNGDVYYTSKILEEIWSEKVGKDENGKTIYKPRGFVLVTNCNFETCSYVARYMLKKQKGLNADYYYKLGLIPPFTRCSRMPGIAKSYYDINRDKIYNYDSLVITNGKGIAKTVKPPKYYDRLYDLEDPEDLKRIKERRTESAENSLKNRLSKTDLDKDTYLALCEDKKLNQAVKLIRPLE